MKASWIDGCSSGGQAAGGECQQHGAHDSCAAARSMRDNRWLGGCGLGAYGLVLLFLT